MKIKIDYSSFTNKGGRVIVPLNDWNLIKAGSVRFRYKIERSDGLLLKEGETNNWSNVVEAIVSSKERLK